MTRGDLALALRYFDRAWRLARHDPTILHLYGQALLAHGDAAASQIPLREAAGLKPCSDVEALLIRSMIAMQQTDAAATRLEAALHRFCVVPDGPLVRVARQVIGHRRVGIRGWVGVAPTLELAGEVTGIGRAASIEIRRADVTLLSREATARGADGTVGRRSRHVPAGCAARRAAWGKARL